MKLRLPAFVLALSLALSVPALAVGHAENFQRSKTYHHQFSDLTADSPFYQNVSALYEFGLSIGKQDGTFGLTDSVTVGEMVIFSGRIRSLYQTGSAEEGAAAFRLPDQSIALPYLLYLQSETVLGAEFDDALNRPALRAEVAHLLANLLPEEELPPINGMIVNEAYATHRILPDVTEYTPYFMDILQLYRCGIVQGYDRTGSFHPDEPITRGAVAALLTRLVDPSLRVRPNWDSAVGTQLKDLVTPAAPVAAPVTPAEMDRAIRSMLSTDSSQLAFQYPSLTQERAQEILSLALSTVNIYCEQSYNQVSCVYDTSGSMDLTFTSSALSGEPLQLCRADSMGAAIAVHDQLWADGTLTHAMSDTEKALVYFHWICEHCSYDTDATDTSISHLPYGLFYHGKAVCDGYTGAYNLLLKLEGIPCAALSNDSHIWTVALLDGELCHIDTTWADQAAEPDEACFGMTELESRQLHPW